MKSSRKPKNPAEGLVWQKLTERGLIVTKKGWPDFAIFTPDGQLKCVIEVKTGNRKLRESQEAILKALARCGIKSYKYSDLKSFEEIT